MSDPCRREKGLVRRLWSGVTLVSQAAPFAERGRVWSHTVTIELLPRQKLAVTNEIHTLQKLHL